MAEGRVRWWAPRTLHLVVLSLLGCGGADAPGPLVPGDEPGVVEPSNPSERQVLRAAGSLPVGVPRRIGNLVVVAEPIYFAGSGRLCRGLTISAGARGGSAGSGGQTVRQLACKQDRQWVFVPNVLITPVSGP